MALRDQGMIRGTGAYGRRQLGIVTKPTGLLLPRAPVHRNRVKYAGAPDVMLQASSWYDARDLSTTTQQTLPNRNNPSATAAQLGSTSGSDTNDPVALPYDGTAYVYLPGTAGNNLSLVKGAWAGTLHVTATLVDNSTATYTTTADPVLIGNTLLAAGRYKKFVVRDTNGSGTVRVTIEPSAETVGQASWTCTTGQTVTVNRSTSGLTTSVVTRPLLMTDGTDDYLRLPAGDTPTFTRAAGAHTLLLIQRRAVDAAGFRWYVSYDSASNNGIGLIEDTGSSLAFVQVGNGAGAVQQNIGAVADGATKAMGWVANTGSIRGYLYGTGLTASTSYAGLTSDPTFSATGGVGIRVFDSFGAIADEVFALVIWPRALTAPELDAASAYLLGSYS